MKPWHVWVMLGLCLCAQGCRVGTSLELLELENRLLEQRIDELNFANMDLQSQLESCQAVSTSTVRESSSRESRSKSRRDKSRSSRSSESRSDGEGPALSSPDVELDDLDKAGKFNGAPEISPPGEVPEGSPPRTNRSDKDKADSRHNTEKPPGADAEKEDSSSAEEGPSLSGADSGTSAENSRGHQPPEEITTPSDENSSAQVSEISLNEKLTSGLDMDSQPGDEGIRVVVEPRSSDGKIVPKTGNLSIVVLDPSQSGSAARVARWDISAEEAKRHLRHTQDGDGIYLSLPWTSRPPKNESLHLFVRYTTSAGQRLVADQPLSIKLAGSASASASGEPIAGDRGDWERSAPRAPNGDVADESRANSAAPRQPHSILKRNGSNRSRSPAPANPRRGRSPELNRPAEELPPPKEKTTTRPRWSPYR